MKKIIFIMLMCISTLVFAQTNHLTKPVSIDIMRGPELIVKTGSRGSVVVSFNATSLSFVGKERDNFLSFLDVQINLLEEIAKVNLIDGSARPVVFLTNETTRVNTSLHLRKEEQAPFGYMYWYIQPVGTYQLLYLNKENLVALRTAFKEVFDFNKQIDNKEGEVQKLIVEAKTAFTLGN